MDRMQMFTQDELNLIHDTSMEILAETGVRFFSDEVTAIFQSQGFRIDGTRVLFTEQNVQSALKHAPSRFTIQARNPANNVAIGEDDFVFVPTGGAPNVVNAKGERRPATLEDYHTCCRLVQSSDQLEMSHLQTVQPMDVPARVAHLDMLNANMVMSDKAYVGAAESRQFTIDFLEMAAIAWGGKENLKRQAVMANIINPMSPLKYSTGEAESIVETARLGQPLVITNLVMAGSSGPVSLPGLLALANAEILAGLVLAQLVRPGTPVIYGSVSAPADMRTIVSAVGAPEAVVLASAIIQLAKYYKLPCRTGGMLTSAHCLDAQAAAEGTLLMSTAVRNGANFIAHACGQLGSYISMSFEKWLFDEEVCRMIRRTLACMDVSVESIDVATIKNVGSDGNYLMHDTTFKYCRNLYQTKLFTREDYQKWHTKGAKDVSELAADLLQQRLEDYAKPPIDEGLEQAVSEFVKRRKKQLLSS